MERLAEAISLATQAHEGQFDKAGFPYIAHPFRVMLRLHNEAQGEDMLIAAILHDVVEDTNITLQEVTGAFGSKVGYLVDAVSRRRPDLDSTKDETYFDFIRRVKASGPEAITLKLADIADNTDPRRPRIGSLADKYAKARAILLGEEA